jgi:bifunctional DNA-binding transcriptional regulator/antitoxin component of YhaV-PrlF toxin-antitoxin module
VFLVKTTLNADGKITIPDDILRSDRLTPGDSFELERVTSGHYLLTKEPGLTARFTIGTGTDGLPVIRTDTGTITAKMVKDIEGQIP